MDRLQRVAHLADIIRDELDREVIDRPELSVLVGLRDEAMAFSEHLWTAHAETHATDH